MLIRTMAASQEVEECIESLQSLVQLEQLNSLNINKYLPVTLYEKGKIQ